MGRRGRTDERVKRSSVNSIVDSNIDIEGRVKDGGVACMDCMDCSDFL